MDKRIEIVLPEELKEFVFINTISTPGLNDFEILIMGQDLEPLGGQLPTIRLYLIKKHDSEYHFEDEIEAFSFLDTATAMNFAINLPQMTALELLLMMNGQVRADENNVMHH